VAAVDREERDVRTERLERRLHPLVVDRVARVVDPHAIHLQDEADEADQPAGELLSEPIGVVHRDAVTRPDRPHGDAGDLMGLARLDAQHALRRDPGLRDHVGDRCGNDERRSRGSLGDRRCALRVEVIEVFVAAEHDVDAVCRRRREGRLVPSALVRR
jgi:hypothetical protein